jgi:hypothetical protein
METPVEEVRMRSQALAIGGGALASALVLRGLYRRNANWGATADEIERELPGDDAVPGANYRVTRAVTIDARPEDVWPWLMQMGDGRGGLYSYDGLDRLFGFTHEQSATEILGYEDLQPGDVIPIGRGGDFPVREVIPNRALVLAGSDGETTWMWSLVLQPLDDGRTRLISRNLGVFPGGVRGALMRYAIDTAAIIMTRRMLLNLKGRAEGMARSRSAEPVGVAAGPS